MPVGIVLFAHGSSIASANAAVDAIAQSIADAGGYLVQAGFLEPVRPTLDEAATALIERGGRSVRLGGGAAGGAEFVSAGGDRTSWGGPPGPRRTPSSACRTFEGKPTRGSAADQGVRPTTSFLL